MADTDVATVEVLAAYVRMAALALFGLGLFSTLVALCSARAQRVLYRRPLRQLLGSVFFLVAAVDLFLWFTGFNPHGGLLGAAAVLLGLESVQERPLRREP